MEIKNKTILITGASKGIGKAAAITLSKLGARVIINYKSDDKSANETLNECNNFSTGNTIMKADVSKEDEVAELYNHVKRNLKTIDILINNAGIFDSNDSPLNIDAFDNTYRSNFKGAILMVKHCLPLMQTGKIINISSIYGRVGHGNPDSIAYSSFKAALNSYTKNLAKALAPNILVNAVAPGRVATPMWGVLNDQLKHEYGQVHAIKRMIEPEEIADAIIFLIKNDAMCGEILTIDGGYSLNSLN